MTEEQESTNSPAFCWSANKGSFSTDMNGCIFHLLSVLIQFLQYFVFQNCLQTAADHSLINTELVSRYLLGGTEESHKTLSG
jgi:hypothetical protein